VKAAAALRRRFLFVGEPSVWRRAGWRPALGELHDTGLGLAAPKHGRPTAESGRASFAALSQAFALAARGVVGGIVTAPISKSAWAAAGVPYTDHTEYLRERTGADLGMVLAAPDSGLWCALATRHVPLKEAIAQLSVARVLSAARVLSSAGKKRLVLCGLNPHAGEDGLLGGEEKSILAPAAAAARRAGLSLTGPVAADAAWRLHAAGRYDGVVCLYHDQALIPLKAAAGLSILNWTVGLDGLVRTSPGHGTGFDIAGKGIADPRATVHAARLALTLVGGRQAARL
jgi:4-hydroxy-L-threonine phosphate dehydrogenase PdxA